VYGDSTSWPGSTTTTTTFATRAFRFTQRATCSVNDARVASGLGRSGLYNLMNEGKLKFTKIGKRRLINVPSLLDLLRS